jgi:hypothetical protein
MVGRKPAEPGLGFVEVLRLFAEEEVAVRISSDARDSLRTIDADRVGV